jgi:acetate kinase
MLILIANVGSSSMKCRLFDMPSEKVIAQARVERAQGDRASALRGILDQLTDPETGVLRDLSELDAVGFKPVYAKGITGCQHMDNRVLSAMEDYSSVLAPLHNPMYIEAIRAFREALPDTPLVGLFENFFFDSMPDYATVYSIPWDWTEKHQIKKHGWHGASHFYVSRRVAELMGRDVSEISTVTCHLGGSSSLAAIKGGTAVDVSFGFSTQTGLPQGERSGDIDPFLVPFLLTRGEGTLDEILHRLAFEGGLSAISGMGFDMRDLEQAAANGHARAKLAIDTYVYYARKYLGSFMFGLGHTDAITFAGGTGEGSAMIRATALEGLEEFGIVLDSQSNEAREPAERKISAPGSRTEVWVVPTNEEIVVARECYKLLAQ